MWHSAVTLFTLFILGYKRMIVSRERKLLGRWLLEIVPLSQATSLAAQGFA